MPKSSKERKAAHDVNPQHLGKDERMVLDFLNKTCRGKVDEIKSILD